MAIGISQWHLCMATTVNSVTSKIIFYSSSIASLKTSGVVQNLTPNNTIFIILGDFQDFQRYEYFLNGKFFVHI
jgi:hypothetical protein